MISLISLIAIIFATIFLLLIMIYAFLLTKYPWPKIPKIIDSITKLDINYNDLKKTNLKLCVIDAKNNNELIKFCINDEHGYWDVEVEFCKGNIVGYGYTHKSNHSFFLNRGGSYQSKNSIFYMREVSG